MKSEIGLRAARGRRIQARLRKDGWSGVVRATLDAMWIDRRLDLFCRPIAAGGPDEFPSPPDSWVSLGAGDLDEYLGLRPEQSREEIRRRFDLGNLCFGVRRDHRLVAAVWGAPAGTPARVDFLDCWIQPMDRAFYAFDGLVAPECRGARLGESLGHAYCAHMRAAGLDTVVSLIWPLNRVTQGRLRILTDGRVGQIIRHRWRGSLCIDLVLAPGVDDVPVRLIAAPNGAARKGDR